MKKIRILPLLLLVTGTLVGCTSSRTLVKDYKNTSLSAKTLIININQEDDWEFFGKNLAVFPKNEKTISVSEPKEKSETEEESSISDEDESEETTEAEEEVDDTSSENSLENQKDTNQIDSKSGLLAGIDTLENVYGKNVYDRVYPASVTKIMTALIALEKANFSDKVTFTEDMVVTEYGAKLCGFNVGDELTVEQLFYSLLIYSGNDAANALAIHIGGSIEGFSDMMNKKAKNLGCVDTHFVNPSGLHDNDHYTSAYDLYLIFNECLKYDSFIDAIRQRSYSISYKDASGEIIENYYTTTNQYFVDAYDYPDSVRVLGGKTGTTDEAGSCLILYDVDKNSQGYISVILGADDSDELYSEMNILLNKIPK